MKKPAGSVRFYNQKTEKTEPNRNETDKKPKKTEPKPSQTGKTDPKPSQTEKTEPKPSQNRKNRAKPVWTGFCPKKTEPNRTETGRFDPVLVRFRFFFQKKKNFGLVTFFDKNRTEPKMITPKNDLRMSQLPSLQ